MWAPVGDIELPIIEKINDPQELLAEIIESIQQRDSRTLKTRILEHKLKDNSIFWDLILQLGSCINSETCEKHPDFFDVCNRCLMYIIKVGNPKENLLALLEQIDTFIDDDVKYKNFLPPIQTSLMNISSKRFHSLDITLETVSSHIRSIGLPENTQLEGEEVKLFHADKTVIRLTDVLFAYLKFLEPFVDAVYARGDRLTAATKQESIVLKKHLIQVFENPLCYLVLTHDPDTDRVKFDSRLCAELAMSLLTKIETDFHRLIRNAAAQLHEKRDTKDDDNDKPRKQDTTAAGISEDNKPSKQDTTATEISGDNKLCKQDSTATGISRDNKPCKQDSTATGISGDNKPCKQDTTATGISKEEHDNMENERKLTSANDCRDDVIEKWDFKLDIHPLALSCLAYLIHVEHMGLEKYPSVFRHDYLLDFHLETLSILLQNTNYPVNHKGLLLCKVLTELVPKHSIPDDSIDNYHYMIVINALINIMIRCPVRDHRALATAIFPTIISRFQVGGRYHLYQNILSSCEHSGLKGHLVTILKNDLSDSLKTKPTPPFDAEATEVKSLDESKNILPSHFSGRKLEKLMKLVLLLPEGETTDMLENSDQIISSLNFLRFLVIADSPTVNATGFWNFLQDVEKDFLTPVRRGLELSRAHYVLERDSMSARKQAGCGLSDKSEPALTVSGMTLPLGQEKAEIMEMAINTHDVMQSILGRLSELIDQQKRLQIQ